MTKSLIIFDLDGTLIDSVPDLADGVDKMLAHFDKPPAGTDNVRTWVGNGSTKLVERALVWAGLSLDNLHHAHELFLTEYTTCQGKTVEYDGVTDGLNRLIKQGLTLALCTNKPAQFLPDILANMGWTDKFACIIGGDSLPTKKPDPAPLLHICTTLGVDKSQAVMVGDSKNDITAGQNAGITTLALTYGYNYGEPIADSRPDGVFDNFGDLVAFLL
ncbi:MULTISPECIES: phosphoglycolate phosphatase [Moraxella]|jgi:phosphoglycolate phosphatase, bacterial|uniref:Phosphoglycolate phosphatase n=1 Tax=Moraxella lacunata TaxID=477 RepID=A0A1B8PZJ4_MORLA|nr:MULTISPECIES: phosphoglycolate phosphatase [Moraxella]MBE9578177.1 phosphoglycolate phosphatase [Moraxella sp. K1664]MBE9588146.1 phosphoglycolate phosphatase [Moraxella sp. K1630]MBE9589778.1 phosphoglycolate phosphatase [Moraxella sp. K127]MBE9596262.1 phosphoglycolate phosphatase [Moraxella sp. K2450]MDH9218620.1 phosphoglycolate phosphatase [Moraxella lacunata]